MKTQPLARVAALKKKIGTGAPISACWVTIHDPACVEIVADTGFDLAIVDSEHAPWGALALQTALLAFRASPTVPVLRTLSHEDALIKQALDIGFEGLVIPNVVSAGMAASAVASAKYPPMGTRGFGPRRASSYGREPGYKDAANDDLLMMVQIEHKDAVAVADAIMSTPGIDAAIIGPNDLSGSYGRLGEHDHPEVKAAIDETLAAGARTGTPVGYGVPMPPARFADMRRRGFQVFSVAADVAILTGGLDASLSAFADWVADTSHQ